MIKIILGDITRCSTDVIVNAANSSLMGGGGVDGAIHRAGGYKILEACKVIVDKSGPCKTGEAVITTAGNLKSKYVIHTVGPIWRGGNNGEALLLAACYDNSLKLATQHHCNSIAFPNISTGVYGYPKELAAAISLQTVYNYLKKNQSMEVVFVCFDEENKRLLESEFSKISDQNKPNS